MDYDASFNAAGNRKAAQQGYQPINNITIDRRIQVSQKNKVYLGFLKQSVKENRMKTRYRKSNYRRKSDPSKDVVKMEHEVDT